MYLGEEYDQVGMVDIQSADHTVYRWGSDAVGAIPRSPFNVRVFKRLDFSY